MEIKTSYCIKTLTLIIAALWGIPWINAAIAGVVAIGLDLMVFKIIAAIGIVVTVGADGFWLMSRALTLWSKPSAQNFQPTKAMQITIILLALISCLPGTYAAFRFNHGIYQFSAIIIFIGSLGSGLYAYWQLMPRLTGANPVFALFHRTNRLKAWQYSIAGLMGLSLTIVDFYLVHHFMITYLTAQWEIIWPLALITALPNGLILFISSLDLSNRLRQRYQPTNQALARFKKTYYLSYLRWPIALTAPSATAFIGYTTLSEQGLATGSVWLAIMPLIIGRITFSFFTLTQLYHRYMRPGIHHQLHVN